nr:MAG TPA: hypothetical protein [Caudoviricetes sp.]
MRHFLVWEPWSELFILIHCTLKRKILRKQPDYYVKLLKIINHLNKSRKIFGNSLYFRKQCVYTAHCFFSCPK